MLEHHATVCIADTLECSSVPEIYRTQSSDVTHILTDRFSIDDARILIQDSLQKPINSQYRVFVLVVKKLPEESQNALLKLFEEPPNQTRFFLVIPQLGILIPTLLSRVQVQDSDESDIILNTVFDSFITDNYAGRLALIADITKKKDLESIEVIMRGAEEYVEKEPKKYPEFLKSILFVRKYTKTPGASVKMLLEELALSLPVVK